MSMTGNEFKVIKNIHGPLYLTFRMMKGMELPPHDCYGPQANFGYNYFINILILWDLVWNFTRTHMELLAHCLNVQTIMSPERNNTLIAKFMGPTWGQSGANRTQVGPMNFAIWVSRRLSWSFQTWYTESIETSRWSCSAGKYYFLFSFSNWALKFSCTQPHR